MGRKRKKSKHDNLDAIISYLHDNENNRKRSYRENDDISSFQRRSKRRKLRHSIEQIRNDDDTQKSFYKASSYHNIDINNDKKDENNDIDLSDHNYCIWQFNHPRFVHYVCYLCKDHNYFVLFV